MRSVVSRRNRVEAQRLEAAAAAEPASEQQSKLRVNAGVSIVVQLWVDDKDTSGTTTIFLA